MKAFVGDPPATARRLVAEALDLDRGPESSINAAAGAGAHRGLDAGAGAPRMTPGQDARDPHALPNRQPAAGPGGHRASAVRLPKSGGGARARGALRAWEGPSRSICAGWPTSRRVMARRRSRSSRRSSTTRDGEETGRYCTSHNLWPVSRLARAAALAGDTAQESRRLPGVPGPMEGRRPQPPRARPGQDRVRAAYGVEVGSYLIALFGSLG